MQGEIRTFHREKRKRDSDEDTGKPESPKISRLDSTQIDSNREKATQKALDVLLEPPERERTPREQEVYRQSLEELRRLNTGDFAINAQRDQELALYAARRAHLKALTFPRDFSDKHKNDWKPGGKWAQCAETAKQYEQQVRRVEHKRQQLENECPIPTLNEAVNSSELNNAISTYKQDRQQDNLKYCQILKAKLGTIRDYLEGKPIGIAKAQSAWNEIKDEQKKSEFIAIVDLRQLLNLPYQETTSSVPDQGSHALMTQETVFPPHQLRDVEMKSPDYDLAQQQFEQFRRHAEDMLKALPDNEFKTTSQARYDALITTYTTMTPDTALQDVYTQMTELHNNLIQRDVETIQAWFQKIRPNIREIAYAEFEKLVQEHKEMPYEDKIPRNKQQMVDLHDRMMHFHQEQATTLFETAQLYVEAILREFPEVPLRETNQEKYDTLTKIELREVSSYQLQEALDNMIALHHDLTRWSFQKSKVDIEILLDITQQDHVRTQFQLQESTWNKLESERNDSVHLDGELRIIDDLLKVENSLIQIIYKQQTKASIDDLLSQFNSSEFKTQFKDLKSEYQNLASSWDTQELAWENLTLEEEKRGNLDQRYTTVRLLLNYHHRLASTIYEQTQSRIQQLLPMLAEDEFKQTSQTKHTNLIEERPQGDIAIDNLREHAKSSQTWQGAVANLLDLHSDLAQVAIKQTHASVEQLLQLPMHQIEPPAAFVALIKRCREDLFSPNTRSADQSPADERPIGDWQKEEKNTEARANDWQEIVKGMEDFHTRLANTIYEQTQKEVLPLITQMQDSLEKRWYQEDFGAQQTEYKESTNPGQKQLVLQRMADTHKDLLPLDFQRHHSYIQYSLHHHIKDPQRKTEYQTRLDELQTSYSKSLNLDRRRWQEGLHKIIYLRNIVVDHDWKDGFQQLQANIEQRLQALQDDVVEDQYRKTYATLIQNYSKLVQEGKPLGISSETRECYEKMALFHKDLLGVSEMNRRQYELKDDTKEIEYYANELEEGLQRQMSKVHRVWSENEQDQSITYAHFTDLKGNEHLKEKVEVVNGTNTKTHEAVQGYYCSETRHFISSDRQAIYDAELIGDQQLKLKGLRETPWEQRLRQWSKPADTQARIALEGAKQRIWKVLSRDESPALLELTLGFHGSYLSKTTISSSDADIHVAFNNRPLNNPLYNDLPKYREIMNNALIKAFTEQHVKAYETVTTIDKNAFGIEADVFPAFYHTFKGDHKGLISFTEHNQVVTHFLEQKRQNAQAKSDRTAYRFRSVVRILKNLRNVLLEKEEEREQIPSFIIEALVYNTPNEHLVDYTPEDKPIKRELAATLDSVLAYCIDHTATDEKCKEWTEVDGIKYLFNFDANTPWEIEIKDAKYTYSGKHNIPREKVHEFLKQLQEYIKPQQEDQFQSIQLSRSLEVSRSLPERPLFARDSPTIGSH